MFSPGKQAGEAGKGEGETHRNSLRTALPEKVPEAISGFALTQLWFLTSGKTGKLVKPDFKASLALHFQKPASGLHI